MREESPHLISITTNKHGNDLVIGDVHGSATLLKQVIVDMGRHDRLFIVGDLFDRGEDSPGVFNAIQAARAAGKAIHVVRGNHEDILIKACDGFRTISSYDTLPSNFVKTHSKMLNKIAAYITRRGGNWIISDPDLQNRLSDLLKKLLAKEITADETSQLFASIKEVWQHKLEPSLPEIIRYIKSLPYIIKVGLSTDYDKPGNFIICHADLPFNDEELERKIASNHRLTPLEIHHTTWARESSRDGTRLTKHIYGSRKLRTYVGHTPSMSNTRVYRRESNTMVVDSGAHRSGILVVINETQKIFDFKYVVTARTYDPDWADRSYSIKPSSPLGALKTQITIERCQHLLLETRFDPVEVATRSRIKHRFFGHSTPVSPDYPRTHIANALGLIYFNYIGYRIKNNIHLRVVDALIKNTRNVSNSIQDIYHAIKRARVGLGYDEVDAALGFIQRAIRHNRTIDPELLLHKMNEHGPSTPFIRKVLY